MPLTPDRIIARSVDSLINEDGRPITIVLFREVKARNERGGFTKSAPIELDPQTVRLVPFKRRLTLEYRDLPTERTTLIDYILTGPLDTDVKIGDYFDWQPETSPKVERFHIDHVSALVYHRVQATVARRREVVPSGGA